MYRDTHTHTHTHTRARLTALSGTTRVSRCQKGKTNPDFTKARDSEWQWYQLGHSQVCTSLQTDNHASTHRSVFYRPDALPPNQQRQSTEGICYVQGVAEKWNTCIVYAKYLQHT